MLFFALRLLSLCSLFKVMSNSRTPGPSAPKPSFPCHGIIRVIRDSEKAKLLRKITGNATETVTWEQTGVELSANDSVMVVSIFENSSSNDFLYEVTCDVPGGSQPKPLQGWVRQRFVELESKVAHAAPAGGRAFNTADPIELHPLLQKPQCPKKAWIRRNGGANLGGETSVPIYSSLGESKSSVCILQNDVAVKCVGNKGDWSHIIFSAPPCQETTGWVETVHLVFFLLITEQPRVESPAFAAGCPLYLSVQTVNKPGLKYQWQWRSYDAKESEDFANIPSNGSEKRIFVIEAAAPDHSGSYRVTVSSDSNFQEYSEHVKFIVIDPPAGSPFQKSQGNAPNSSSFNVLLMGETGTGKSTFVNLLANHFAPSSFANKDDIKVAIKTAHLNVSSEYLGLKGSEAGGAASDAQTQTCSTYSMTKKVLGRGRCTFNFIDSPGLNDPRGKDQDDKVSTIDIRNIASSNFSIYFSSSEFEQHFTNA
jgi:hypothetical protein